MLEKPKYRTHFEKIYLRRFAHVFIVWFEEGKRVKTENVKVNFYQKEATSVGKSVVVFEGNNRGDIWKRRVEFLSALHCRPRFLTTQTIACLNIL